MYILKCWCFDEGLFWEMNADGRRSRGLIIVEQNGRPRSKSMFMKALEDLSVITHVDGVEDDQSSNTGPYGVSSPFNLPPFDSLPPVTENAPPYCIYPPFTPPSTGIPTLSPPPTPLGSGLSPPETIPSPIQNPPVTVPSPFVVPTPSGPVFTPPYIEPSPPGLVPSPPSLGFEPSPPVFQPPVVYPPPTRKSPPGRGPSIALWCVAKPSVPDPIVQEAMNYACGSGADCDTIQPSGPCFEPNTVYAHASYAFNSYWQRTKVAGGTCSFGGVAMLVTVDPSKHFNLNWYFGIKYYEESKKLFM